jgi:hypothetical protein
MRNRFGFSNAMQFRDARRVVAACRAHSQRMRAMPEMGSPHAYHILLGFFTQPEPVYRGPS